MMRIFELILVADSFRSKNDTKDLRNNILFLNFKDLMRLFYCWQKLKGWTLENIDDDYSVKLAMKYISEE